MGLLVTAQVGGITVLLGLGVRATFTVAGLPGGVDQDVRRLVEEAGSPHLRSSRRVPAADVIERIARATVYVVPSVHDSFPMAVLQAMPLACPCVVTEASGLAATIRERRGPRGRRLRGRAGPGGARDAR